MRKNLVSGTRVDARKSARSGPVDVSNHSFKKDVRDGEISLKPYHPLLGALVLLGDVGGERVALRPLVSHSNL